MVESNAFVSVAGRQQDSQRYSNRSQSGKENKEEKEKA